MTFVLVAAGAAVGAPTRWWVDVLVQRRWAPVFPWGTFMVNVVGSLLLGVFAVNWRDNDSLWALLGVGFCGAMTTFSSFGWETYRLAEDGAAPLAFLNVCASLVVCVLAAAAGWALAG
jgi:CrcB protein